MKFTALRSIGHNAANSLASGSGLHTRPVSALTWFVAVLVTLAASQIIRLHQSDPEFWIFWDYAGRLGALFVLMKIPAARAVAFRKKSLQTAQWKAALGIVGVVVADHFVGDSIRHTINAAVPTSIIGGYPKTVGLLHWVDVVSGLALVAYSEEVIFRRCARYVFQPFMGDGYLLVLFTSVLFGAYHWWAGLGTIAAATITGMLLMLLFKRCGALWPSVLAHYLVDALPSI